MDGTSSHTKDLIDIENVFRSKNPAILKVMPGFILNYLKRIVHEAEINAFVKRHRNAKGLDFVEAGLTEFGAKVQVKGIENVNEHGKYIIASNHPLGGLDGLALMKSVGEVRKDIIFPVNDILMNIPNLHCLFIPINKHGSNSDNVRIINETFASESIMLYFPAGLVSRKQSGNIADLQWKKTFVTKAKQFQRDIIPVHIDGRNSNFFYNLARLRGRLKIKANIEMLYLVNEMYKQRDKIINITFGKPIPHQIFDKRNNHMKWAALVREHVYELEREPEKVFNY